MRLADWIERRLDEQRTTLFLWVPVVFAIGIAAYFALRWEPGRLHWTAITVVMVCLLSIGWWRGAGRRLLVTTTLIALSGFGVAGIRAHLVAETVLGYRYYGPVEGRIVGVDRSSSDAVRLTLDRVRLRDVPPDRTPARVRIALHGQQGYLTPEPGLTIIATAHLSPPGGAVEPGGFDFRRQAWFQRLGAVGYTRVPVLAYAAHDGWEWSLEIYRLRMRISGAVQAAMGQPAGGFAAAITTGDRSGIDAGILDALRVSNLAHLLAISGLHMGLLTGFVFSALRIALAVIPGVAVRWPTRKFAAVVALMAGTAYLALSGGNVATERAYVMVAVMFIAILADRRAVTLRSVAVAAMVVLTLRPESLYGPGFQMSFAATTALVAVYAQLRGTDWSPARWPRWLSLLAGVTLSSFVAGMATAPIAAAHFNQVPHYGLLANVISVPLMGAIIIPAAVLAVLLAPVGLAWIGLWLMEPPIRWILGVAQTVAGWPGAVSVLTAPGAGVLPLVSLGGLWVVIVLGRGRLAGILVVLAALALWTQAERPLVLVSQSGGLVGLMTNEGRVLSKARGDGFAAEIWLENDGDRTSQEAAHARAGLAVIDGVTQLDVGGLTLLHATGKVASAKAIARCRSVAVVIVNIDAAAPDGCDVYDAGRLAKTGALAIVTGADGPRVVTTAERTGRRLWSQ